MAFRVPEQYRVRRGTFASSPADGCNGAFQLTLRDLGFDKSGRVLVIASDRAGWEHVSVSLSVPRCPTWEEMCAVKALFWEDDDCVVQYHPPRAEHVSFHDTCLHLWRPIGVTLASPPAWMVGPKAALP